MPAKESTATTPRDTKAILERYRSVGFLGGLLLGGVGAAMIAGPHFNDWSATRSLVTLAGSLGLGGLMGYIAGEIAVASQASPVAPGLGGDDTHSGGHGDGGSDGGGGGGDGGGSDP